MATISYRVGRPEWNEMEKAKATAGPSTPFVAKNAPNSAQDDRAFVGINVNGGYILRSRRNFFVRCETPQNAPVVWRKL